MLVLSRRIGERIVVPDHGLEITVLAVKGQVVRLGLDAPAEVAVFREELWHQMERQAQRPPVKG